MANESIIIMLVAAYNTFKTSLIEKRKLEVIYSVGLTFSCTWNILSKCHSFVTVPKQAECEFVHSQIYIYLYVNQTHNCAVYLQREEQVCSLALLLEEALPDWACLPLQKQAEILKDECVIKVLWFSVSIWVGEISKGIKFILKKY